MRLLIALGLLVFSSVGGDALAQDAVSKDRLVKLTTLFKMNVAGDVYIEFCDPEKALLKDSYYYVNVKATEYHLSKALARSQAQHDVDQAIKLVYKKRKTIERAAGEYYSQNGCQHAKAEAAFKHVKRFGTAKSSDIFKYLRRIEDY